MIKETRLLVYLTSIVFNTEIMRYGSVVFDDKVIKKLSSIDENASWVNGLQAVAYETEGEDTIYIVVRGADVGIGKKLFRKTGADARFIPKVNDEDSFKTIFQDWIYSSTLGSMGLVHLYQYDSLQTFYHSLRKKYSHKRFVVSGVSLGGLLAQRLYIFEGGIERCLTFSATSPWWTFNRRSQEMLKESNFLMNDDNLINFYSTHDPFRFLPLFKRHLGQQKNVLLQPFQSRSNFFATVIERMYWAHIPNYYTYTDTGKVRQKEDRSKIQKWNNWLNSKASYSKLVNIAVLVMSVLLALVLALVVPILNTYEVLSPIYTLEASFGIFFSLASGFLFLCFLLPTLVVKTNWKYLMFLMNLAVIWFAPFWVLLLALSIIFESISNKEENINKRIGRVE